MNKINTPLFVKSQGFTESERYLQKLCNNSFLSLWSYTNIFRDQGQNAKQSIGKEVCDLLVVFGNHILIFSDKDCVFPNKGNVDIDWIRWYKRAIKKSADQIYGAERWIRDFPNRLFLDKECVVPFPIAVPDLTQAIFHRIIVAHGAKERCIQYFGGGSGSLVFNSDITEFDCINPDSECYQPFTIGKIDPNKEFIHILDDTSLDIVLSTLDTIYDFTDYLSKKEIFIKNNSIIASGEEDILAYYLQNINKKSKEHSFPIVNKQNKVTKAFLEEGFWEDFKHSNERMSQIIHNKISYFWDNLINNFTHHLINNSLYNHDKNHNNTELILRLLASENRLRRRVLSESFLSAIHNTPDNYRSIRIIPPSKKGEVFYVFFILPYSGSHTEESYRKLRQYYLNACCLIVKLKYPNSLDIIGIATETEAIKSGYSSEDIIYFDGRKWNDDLRAEAIKLQHETGFLTNTKMTFGEEFEYPSERHKIQKKIRSKYTMKGRDRNKPCICGSYLKFKNCCGRNMQ